MVAVMGGQGDFDTFDIGADGITITEERAEHVDFSEPYIQLAQVLLVRADEDRFAIGGETEPRRILLGAEGRTGWPLHVGPQAAFFKREAADFLPLAEIPDHHVAILLAAGGEQRGVG